MRILGIDPGLQTTGFGVIDVQGSQLTYVASGVIQTDKVHQGHLPHRLKVIFDGILENPGRIVIMTSNCPEKLDSALIRPGRIDIIAKFGYCTLKTMQEMMEFFYDTTLSHSQIQALQGVRVGHFTPAEISRVFFENFTDPDAALSTLQQLSTRNEIKSTQITSCNVSENEEKTEEQHEFTDSYQRIAPHQISCNKNFDYSNILQQQENEGSITFQTCTDFQKELDNTKLYQSNNNSSLLFDTF
jgi:SpoVK/Ycf46/Vps4 family AAA+-type ATPase